MGKIKDISSGARDSSYHEWALAHNKRRVPANPCAAGGECMGQCMGQCQNGCRRDKQQNVQSA